LKEINAIKPLQIAITDDMRAKGFTGTMIEVPLVFDPATFFV
jgi:hypothetical protein